jgi:hypothetical protein
LQKAYADGLMLDPTSLKEEGTPRAAEAASKKVIVTTVTTTSSGYTEGRRTSASAGRTAEKDRHDSEGEHSTQVSNKPRRSPQKVSSQSHGKKNIALKLSSQDEMREETTQMYIDHV